MHLVIRALCVTVNFAQLPGSSGRREREKGKKKKRRGKKKKRKKRGTNFQLGWGSNRGGKFNLEVFNRVTPYQEMFCPSEN